MKKIMKLPTINPVTTVCIRNTSSSFNSTHKKVMNKFNKNCPAMTFPPFYSYKTGWISMVGSVSVLAASLIYGASPSTPIPMAKVNNTKIAPGTIYAFLNGCCYSSSINVSPQQQFMNTRINE